MREQGRKNMKVLVVDDNHVLADSIQGILEDKGMEVMSAGNGQEGYNAYLLFKPDLVITDIQMPGENGLEMMAHIRTHNPMVKTIYMSGNINAFRSSLEGEKKRYPVCFFEKPFSLESLTMLVSEPAAGRPGENAFAP
jgi:DNA-binding NtrC family response regulator